MRRQGFWELVVAFDLIQPILFNGNTYFSTKEGEIIRLDKQAMQTVKLKMVEYLQTKTASNCSDS